MISKEKQFLQTPLSYKEEEYACDFSRFSPGSHALQGDSGLMTPRLDDFTNKSQLTTQQQRITTLSPQMGKSKSQLSRGQVNKKQQQSGRMRGPSPIMHNREGVPHLGIMQRTATSTNASVAGKVEKRKTVNNNDLDELFNQTKNSKASGKVTGMSIFQERMMRSKQLNETSELVCISSALLKNQQSGGKRKKAVLSPSESIGVKNKCNQMRKFTPLSRYFGVAKAQGGNPLLKDGDGTRESVLSF